MKWLHVALFIGLGGGIRMGISVFDRQHNVVFLSEYKRQPEGIE